MKKALVLLITVLFLISSVACAQKKAVPSFNKEVKSSSPDNKTVAENERYTLEIDELTMGITLTDRLDGNKWGTSPSDSGEAEVDELGMPVKKNNMVNSAITVRYKKSSSSTDMGNNEADSYSGAVLNGRTVCKAIKNGIRIEYYFDEQEFMVPVDYVLFDRYVSISVDPTLIQEEKENIVVGVSLAPFFCSAENNTQDGYLFVPSGCGALVDTASKSGLGGKYQAPVYGKDYSTENWYTAVNTKDIRMPVFGVKAGNKGAVAVIESGAEAAEIAVTSGSSTYKHSSVYAAFNLRGSTYHLAEVYDDETAAMMIFSEQLITETVSVRYYPLTGERANYNGMAEVYRSYLTEECALQKNGGQVTVNLNFIGGLVTTKSFLGIPYKSLQPATTLNQVSDFVSQLSKQLEGISVSLKGFGADGINIGKIAGDYKLSDKLGSSKELKELSGLCSKNNISLFMNFETVRFSKSGNGSNTFFNSVCAASNQRTSLYLSDKAVHDNAAGTLYYLLKPSKLTDVFERLVGKVSKWEIGGISADTMTAISYSDYSDSKSSLYYSKTGFAECVADSIKTVKKAGMQFASSDANIYAAVCSDLINDVPVSSTRSHIFMCDIPFYQMVLSGYIPMTVESVNLSDDPTKTLLFAVESGSGLAYTLIGEWNKLLINSEYPYFHSSFYSGTKDEIISTYKRLSDYYKCIKNASIVSHEILESGVRATLFDNGVKVYVNYTTEPAITPVGEVGARDFIVKGG